MHRFKEQHHACFDLSSFFKIFIDSKLSLFLLCVEYRVLRHLGEGTFSEVLKAESVKTRQKVAIKCMKSHFDRIEQVCTTHHHIINSLSLGTKSARN